MSINPILQTQIATLSREDIMGSVNAGEIIGGSILLYANYATYEDYNSNK